MPACRRRAAGELRRLDERLAEIARDLPQANGDFDMLAELCGAHDTVRSDLLAHAVDTLTVAATAQETELRRRFDERQALLVAPVV